MTDLLNFHFKEKEYIDLNYYDIFLLSFYRIPVGMRVKFILEIINSTFKKILKKRHIYHIVDNSPWPIITSISVLNLVLGFTGVLHRIEFGIFLFILGILSTILSVSYWFKDIIMEATYQGKHTTSVQQNMRSGITWFIVSEIMLFFSFFWAFFHFSLSPSIEIGSVWPPKDFPILNPYNIPLLNTIILIVSGGTLTWAHILLSMNNTFYNIKFFNFFLNEIFQSLLFNLKQKYDYLFKLYFKYKENLDPFFFTLILAFFFTEFQMYEYIIAPFAISDSVFGSVFFMTTGLHGLHVIIGTIFILVGFLRFLKLHFRKNHHIGFDSSAWYWHFVDVVWILLYLLFYVWSFRINLNVLEDIIKTNILNHIINLNNSKINIITNSNLSDSNFKDFLIFKFMDSIYFFFYNHLDFSFIISEPIISEPVIPEPVRSEILKKRGLSHATLLIGNPNYTCCITFYEFIKKLEADPYISKHLIFFVALLFRDNFDFQDSYNNCNFMISNLFLKYEMDHIKKDLDFKDLRELLPLKTEEDNRQYEEALIRFSILVNATDFDYTKCQSKRIPQSALEEDFDDKFKEILEKIRICKDIYKGKVDLEKYQNPDIYEKIYEMLKKSRKEDDNDE